MPNPRHNGTGSPMQQLGPSRAEHWTSATWVGILVTSPWSSTTCREGAFLTTLAPAQQLG